MTNSSKCFENDLKTKSTSRDQRKKILRFLVQQNFDKFLTYSIVVRSNLHRKKILISCCWPNNTGFMNLCVCELLRCRVNFCEKKTKIWQEEKKYKLTVHECLKSCDCPFYFAPRHSRLCTSSFYVKRIFFLCNPYLFKTSH